MFKKKQKSDMKKLIEQDGIELTAKGISEVVLSKLQTTEIAYQFVLEEIEAASKGNDTSINFAKNSDISPNEYNGSMRNSRPEVDGPDGPQQFLNRIGFQLMENTDLMVELRIKVIDNIMKIFSFGKYASQQNALNGGMRLVEAEVDILFIVRNNSVIYINSESDHLFTTDQDGDEKLDGRIVNFTFSGQSVDEIIEIFVAFDESDSYTMFTLRAGMLERLNYVAQAIFTYFAEVGIQSVFSPIERYSTQFVYTFKLYRKNGECFMINNAQTQAYLINRYGIKRDNAGEIKDIFWGDSN